jgi:hypothetical protein
MMIRIYPSYVDAIKLKSPAGEASLIAIAKIPARSTGCGVPPSGDFDARDSPAQVLCPPRH